MENTNTIATFTLNQPVRLLRAVEGKHWTPGYVLTFKGELADGMVSVFRDGDTVTIPTAHIEPAYQLLHGIHWSTRAARDVIAVLETARQNGTRIRIAKGYTEFDAALEKTSKPVGLDWLEEFESEGTISNSTGPMKVPLLIESPRSSGGGEINGSGIVRIKVAGKNGRVLYQHPEYRLPTLTVREVSDEDKTRMNRHDLTHEVLADGKEQARFKSLGAANRYVETFS